MAAWGAIWTDSEDAEGRVYERRAACPYACGQVVYFHPTEDDRAAAVLMLRTHGRTCPDRPRARRATAHAAHNGEARRGE